MKELEPRITENGIDYVLIGDYYYPEFCPKTKNLIMVNMAA